MESPSKLGSPPLRRLLDLGRIPFLNHSRKIHTDSLLSEAATIKIVCAISQLNATPSTRQVQGTTNRVPLCENSLELARAHAGQRWEPQKRRMKSDKQRRVSSGKERFKRD
jgi:hypothetical protein